MENLIDVACENCGKKRKFRLIKHSGKYKNYRKLCAICSKRSRIYETKNFIDVIDCEEKAYSFGFFWADGCINRYKTFTVRLQEKDKEILDFFYSYFGGIRKTRNFKREDGRKYIQEEWQINDVVFINHLKKNMFRNNIDCVPKKYFNHFLRGLIDGDGHFRVINGKLNQISITSNFDDDFAWLKDRLNIAFRITQVDGASKYSAIYLKGGNKALNKFVEWLYKGATIWLKRKKISQKMK